MLARLQADTRGLGLLGGQSVPSFRKQVAWWVTSGKQPETNERRFAELLETARVGTRPKPFIVERQDPLASASMVLQEAARRPGHQTPAEHAGDRPDAGGAGLRRPLHRSFDRRRQRLLGERRDRQARFDAGELPDFLPNTAESAPTGLARGAGARRPRRPAGRDHRAGRRKMMINALNSGAKVFMADFEDALSPTWENVVDGQINLCDAVRRRLDVHQTDGKTYDLERRDRRRWWSARAAGTCDEAHLLVDGEPISASLFDFGLYFFHNARSSWSQRRRARTSTCPSWRATSRRGSGTTSSSRRRTRSASRTARIRATVLIETILAAFEMDEILYELRDHAAGLNAGRWDYIFSLIKKLRSAAAT